MKLPDIYRDWRIMAGLTLIVLGAGNWMVGLQRTRLAGEMIARATNVAPSTDYRNFDEVDSAGAVLQPFTEQQRKVSYATARMDFYHVAFLSGRGMTLVGLALTLAGFVGVIQRDSRRTIRRLSHEAAVAHRGDIGEGRADRN